MRQTSPLLVCALFWGLGLSPLRGQGAGQPVPEPVEPKPKPAAKAPRAKQPAAKKDSAAKGPKAKPSFYKDVLPVLQRRCQVCHRPGAIGPFPLLTYKDAAGWSAMIHEVVKTRRMPPWHADPRVGTWSNDRQLSAGERETILEWVDAGVPKGKQADAPAPRVFPSAKGWQIGKPDVVLKPRRAFKVPKRGVVDYQYFFVPTDFGEDKWVRAVEVKIGARTVVHHVLIFVKYPGAQRSPRVKGGLAGYFASALPGDAVRPYPDGAAKFIPRRSMLVFQIHYTPDGKERIDHTRLGLKFAKPGEKITRRLRTHALFNTRFAIPAGAKEHVVKARYRFKQDQILVGLTPHMHLRGKSFTYILRTPDGKRHTILRIPRYDFNWQNTYRLKAPLFVPKGSVMHGRATFDNSAQNPANPDPKRVVVFGEQTADEMMIGYLDLLEPSEADRKAYQAGVGKAGAGAPGSK